jgi:hypothetical protein
MLLNGDSKLKGLPFGRISELAQTEAGIPKARHHSLLGATSFGAPDVEHYVSKLQEAYVRLNPKAASRIGVKRIAHVRGSRNIAPAPTVTPTPHVGVAVMTPDGKIAIYTIEQALGLYEQLNALLDRATAPKA